MSFSDHKITQFTHRISELADQPNLPADELKARFDSSPEELRKSLNAVCDDADSLENRVDSIITQTFEGVVDKSMLAESLAAELDAKATQTALSAEQTAREDADSSLGSRLSAAESSITTHTSQIAQKCQIYFGTYTGNGAASRTVSLGFRPKAVFVLSEGYFMYWNASTSGGLAVDGAPVQIDNLTGGGQSTALAVAPTGFMVGQVNNASTNAQNTVYHYIAFQ